MLTSLGKFLRKLRIDNNELLKDMAQKLNVSVSFLSAVENGKKRMPSEWNNSICRLYQLNDIQQAQFTEAISETERSIDMDFNNVGDNGRKLAVAFARKLPDFTDEQIEALRRIMQQEDH